MAAMMTDEKSMELAEAGVELLNTVGRIAAEKNIPRGLVVRLFGAFAKRMIELDVRDGDDHAEATQRAIDNFLRGIGFEREPDEPTTPLQ